MVNLSRWLHSVFSSRSSSHRQRIHSSSRVSPYVEFLENRALLSVGSLVALELTEGVGDIFVDVDYRFELSEGEATFTEFGVFAFDTDGTVDGLAPGEDGFEDAVLASDNREALISGGTATGISVDRTFNGQTRLGVYFCQETTTSSSENHVSLLSSSENTLRVGWDETTPIYQQVGPSPRWFDDAIMLITVGNPVANSGIFIDPVGDQAVLEEQDLELTVTVSDTNRDESLLRFQLDEAPDGASIDAVTGLFTWTPDQNQGPGAFDVTVRVFDSSDPNFFNTETFTIAVIDAENLVSAQLTLFVDGNPEAFPANIGIQSDGSTSSAFTADNSGRLLFDMMGGGTLGEFFETWRTNAGLAENNPDAVFNGNQLLDNVANATSTVQMFVNGQINRDFENYVVQPDDEITIVYGSNPVLSMNTNFGSMLIELFPDETPITVDNFLNYVNGTTQNGGDYDGTFFHRSADINGEDFVIQAGGFSTASEIFTDASLLPAIVTDPEIANEPGISNLRATIAMAKRGGNPNSATNQFFVNLSDSNAGPPASLDTQNGGFTVFGRVLVGMTTADEIAALPTRNEVDPNDPNTSAFGELPVSNNSELAVIQSFAGQGSLTGVKFQDTNQDGDQDPGEVGIAGVTIYIDANNNGVFDSGELSTTTDANGRYLLQADPGTHILRAEISNGAMQTAPTTPDSYTAVVELGRVLDMLNFGEF